MEKALLRKLSFVAVLLIGPILASVALAQNTVHLNQLPAATAPTGTELVPIWQGTKTVAATVTQIANTSAVAVQGPSSSTVGNLLSFSSTNGKFATDSGIPLANVVTLTGLQTLANKSLTAPVISTISNTGTLTLPTVTDTLVGRTTTDTLANKTLASPIITGSFTATGLVTNADMANSSMTLAGHSVSLGGTQTFAASDLTNGTTGTGSIVLAASPAFSGTVTFPGGGAASSAGFSGLAKLGIGMSPSNILDITQSQNAASMASMLNATTGGAAYAAFQVKADETTGLRLIQTSTTYNTDVVNATDPVKSASASQLVGGRAGGVVIAAANGPIRFYSNSLTSETARFDTNGRFLMGEASVSGNLARMEVVGGGSTSWFHTTDGATGAAAIMGQIDNTANFLAYWKYGATNVGTITTNGTSTTYGTTSDVRLKRDLGVATSTFVLRRTKVHDFDWKKTGKRDLGVFAQEAYKVKPMAVKVGGTDPNKNPWQVDYSKFVPDLIVGWQNHEKRIVQLERENAELQREVKALMRRTHH